MVYNAHLVGLMIRFSAEAEEISQLLRFLKKRAPEEQLFFVPLHRDDNDRRLRRTGRALLNDFENRLTGIRWGICTEHDFASGATRADDDTCLMVFQCGPAEENGRRECLLEARDEMTVDRKRLTRRCVTARDLVQRCARRLRRRGHPEKGRWVIE
ncbi:MAG: hypothetical protein OHK0029_00620 [Armatimonadaceae bacterium]